MASAVASAFPCSPPAPVLPANPRRLNTPFKHLASLPCPHKMNERNGLVKFGRNCNLMPAKALPMFVLAAQEQIQVVREVYDWSLDEASIKNTYLVLCLSFCWGCCVFASMADPFYESDAYLNDGGDGSGNWIYEKEEDDEVEGREELLREDLLQEIRDKVGELRELEDADKAKEEELV